MSPRLALAGALAAGVGLAWLLALAGPGRAERPAGYHAAERALAAHAAAAAARARRGRSWTAWESVAGIELRIAGLTGSWEALARAEDALARAFALAAPGSGPFLTRAALHDRVHRWDRALADLDAAERAVLLDSRERARIAALRGSALVQRGRLEDAEAAYALSDRWRPSFEAAAGAAMAAASRGDAVTALAGLDRAEARLPRSDRETRAWAALQRGLIDLDRGRWEDALARYAEADALLSGWWLAQEHIAEVEALLGRTAAARRRYREVVATAEEPELLVALAELEDGPEAARLRARAVAIHRERVARWPEAAGAHGVDLLLGAGDTAGALDLARRDAALRPNPLTLAALAEAQLAAGAVGEASASADAALADGWERASIHAVCAKVYAASGREGEARDQAAVALALNPRIDCAAR